MYVWCNALFRKKCVFVLVVLWVLLNVMYVVCCIILFCVCYVLCRSGCCNVMCLLGVALIDWNTNGLTWSIVFAVHAN